MSELWFLNRSYSADFLGKLVVFFRNQRSIYKEFSKSMYKLDTIIGF